MKPEIPRTNEEQKPSARQIEAEQTRMAYQRLFATEDGQRVLSDLITKFPTGRSRFRGPSLHTDPTISAALIDGTSLVMHEILTAAQI